MAELAVTIELEVCYPAWRRWQGSHNGRRDFLADIGLRKRLR